MGGRRVEGRGRTGVALALVGAAALAGCGGGKKAAAPPTTTTTAAPATSTTSGTPAASGPIQLAAAPPAGAKGHFGQQVAIAALDGGRLVVAYVHGNPDGDDATKGDDQLWATTYDPATKAWSTATKVATFRLEDRFGTDVALAADPSTGNVGLVYVARGGDGEATGLTLEWSTDGGKSFAASAVATGNDVHPSLAMAGGKVALAYQTGDGPHLATGAAAKAAAAPTLTDAAVPGTADAKPNSSTSLQPAAAVTAAGDAFVGFVVEGGGHQLAVWKAGAAAATKVFDDGGHGPDDPRVALAVKGAGLVAMAGFPRDGSEATLAAVATSTDGGQTWSKPANVPASKGNSGPDGLALAAGKGETVLAWKANSGSDDRECGAPVVLGSADLASWTQCLVAAKGVSADGTDYPAAAAGPDGVAYVAFTNPPDGGDEHLPKGVLVWSDGGAAPKAAPPVSAPA